MSTFLLVDPEIVTTASSDLKALGATIGSANAAAAGSTTSVLAAAQDEVSAAISQLFGAYGQGIRRSARSWRYSTSNLCRP